MKTITEDLLNELKSTSDLQSFLNAHEKEFLNKSLASYLTDFISIKNITISSIIKNAGVGEYLYKVFSGERKPSRDILIATAFGMKLSLDETQLLLRIAKFAILDSRDKRDSVIIFGLTHNLTVFQTDDILDEKNMVTIN